MFDVANNLPGICFPKDRLHESEYCRQVPQWFDAARSTSQLAAATADPTMLRGLRAQKPTNGRRVLLGLLLYTKT